MNVVVDDHAVRRVFRRAPEAAVRRLNQLIEASAIDTQAEMRRQVNVGVTGETRRSIRYRTNPGQLSAEIGSNLDPRRIEALEKGSLPHWTSARPGSPLHRWAKFKGLNPYAVQRSIAKKGTKAHPFIQPTYRTMKPKVERLVVTGMARFASEVDSGVV